MKSIFLFGLLLPFLLFAQTKKNGVTVMHVRSAVPEEPPLFPGGLTALNKFIHDNLRISGPYPEGCNLVIAGFMIDTAGTVSNSFIRRGNDPYFNGEVLRVVDLMPKWIPAKTDGKAVPCQWSLPIRIMFK